MGARKLLRLWLAAAFACSQPLFVSPLAAQTTSFDKAIEETKAAMMADPQLALTKSDMAVRIAAELPKTKQADISRATALWLKTEALIGLNRIDDAKLTIEPAIEIISQGNRNTKLGGDILRARGAVASLSGSVQLALKDYLTAHQIFRVIGEKRSEAIALQDIGNLYWEAGDYTRTLRYFAQAAELYDADPGFALSTNNTQGEALRMLGRGKEAEAKYKVALKHARTLDSPLLETRLLSNLALIQVENGKLDEATSNANRALALSANPEAADWRHHVYGVQAKIAAARKDYVKAEQLIALTFTNVALDKTDLVYREVHELAADVYQRQGKFADANAHLIAFQRLDREARDLTSSTSSQLMAARFDFANQNLRISQLKQGQLERDIKLERQQAQFRNRLFLAMGLAALIILAAMVVAFFSIRRSRNEVRAANTVLTSTNVDLEKALRAKSDFLAMTSHEIRTPLNGILGMTQVILANRTLNGDVREQMQLLHTSGTTMKSLVDDLLDTAKLQSGEVTLDLAPVDIGRMLDESARLWSGEAQAKGVDLVLDIADAPAWIETDGVRLKQVVFNLLSNAIKFTDTGSVTLKSKRHVDTSRFSIEVIDTGIGIAADQQSLIFEEFYQVDCGTTRAYSGTGLGLNISGNLVRALGGAITIDSKPGAGSRFCIDLPLIEVAVQPAAAATPIPETLNLRVGLLEQDEQKRAVIANLLGQNFGEVIPVADAVSAEALLTSSAVDVLLIEAGSAAQTPETALADLASLIKLAASSHIATVVLFKPSEDLETAAVEALQADLLLIKPISGSAMVSAIRGHLDMLDPITESIASKAAQG